MAKQGKKWKKKKKKIKKPGDAQGSESGRKALAWTGEPVYTKNRLNLKEKMVVVGVITEKRIRMGLRFKISSTVVLISMLVSIAMYFFFGKLVQPGVGSYIADYGSGDYFAYALLGIAFTAYASMALNIYLAIIQATYWGNTLEMILSSPMGFSTFFLSTTLWAFLVSTINIILYIVFGVGIFGADLGFPSDVWLVLVVLVLAIIAISGFGLMSASMFLLADVKGSMEPVNWGIATFSGLLSGMMFPPEVFLDFAPPLYYASRLLPHTYALDALRRIIQNNESLASPIVRGELIMLVIFCLILFPLGMYMFLQGVRKAERTGKLARWG